MSAESPALGTERRNLLALRWGLVALGVMSFCAARFADSFLDDWLSLRLRTDWRVLSARLSQLKPPFWKAEHLAVWLVLLALGLGVTIVTLFALGLRDAIRPRDDD
jgi:hypothetical protein